MKPAVFQYKRPESEEQLVELLEQYGDEAKIIAGGQSLVSMMNMRLTRPETLIDINRINDLNFIRINGSRIEIGALTRQKSLEESNLLTRFCPILPHAVAKIGHYAIRQRGTVGGSIAHADPSAELVSMALLLDSQITINSAEGERISPAECFFITIYTTELMPNEYIKMVDFRTLEEDEGWAYQDFTRRSGDFAIVSVGCLLNLDGKSRISAIRMTIGGIDDIPLLLQDQLNKIIGKEPNRELLIEVTEEISAQLEPPSDLHASAEYRIDLLRKLIPETVLEAYGRILQGRKKGE